MQVVITGTPGTGKTSAAEEMEKNGWRTVDLTDFIRTHDIGTADNGETEVRIEKLEEKLEESFCDTEDDLVIEGHLSQYYEADYCVVLRCDPDTLKERISKRKYEKRKIEENVEAETLDIILQQSIKKQQKIIEIDTTDKEAGKVAEEIERRIENDETGFGEVDWTDRL